MFVTEGCLFAGEGIATLEQSGNNEKCIQKICKGLTGFLHSSF